MLVTVLFIPERKEEEGQEVFYKWHGGEKVNIKASPLRVRSPEVRQRSYNLHRPSDNVVHL